MMLIKNDKIMIMEGWRTIYMVSMEGYIRRWERYDSK